MVVSFKISLHIDNMKNVLSIRSENSTNDYLNRDEINFMICHICTE